jgi:ferredoxin-type protein NapG
LKRLNLSLTRREFLGLASQTALMVGLGGLIRLFTRNERVLRPPGAIPERDFLAVCVKCQRCSEICPTGVITQLVLEDDLLGFGTPRLDFRLGYCTLCMECVQVCPSGALHAGTPKTVISGVAEINPANCIAWSWGGCTVCHQVCPSAAISLDLDGRPVVSPSQCTACGLCENSCPSSALRSGSKKGSKGITVISQR